MIDYIKELFAASPYIAWTIVLVLIAMLSMATLWDKLCWWWMNTWMRFPFVGTIARLSKDHNSEINDKTWYKSEKAVCSKYKKFIQIMDEHDFNERVEYLVLSGDNGRSNMPGWLWFAIVFIVFLEAMGFSYVLAGYTIPGASENLQQAGAYGIAALISVLLVALTHFSGHELYRTGKINDARAKWQQNNRATTLGTQIVPLAKAQSTDAEEPHYSRMINRIGSSNPSLKITIATTIFIAIIAVGATYVRGQVLDKMIYEDVIGKTQQIQINAASDSDGLDMSSEDIQLPAADAAQDNSVQQQAIKDGAAIDGRGGWGTFIILAILFIFLQLLGILFGFKWGFVGQNSKSAYKELGNGKFTTYSEVMNYYHYVADTAQSTLEDLQQRMMDRNSESGTKGLHTTKTFRDYMGEYRANRSTDLDDQRAHKSKQDINRTSDLKVISPADSPIENVLSQIDSLEDKNQKVEFMQKLSVDMQKEVMSALKDRKINAEKMKIELEGLF